MAIARVLAEEDRDDKRNVSRNMDNRIVDSTPEGSVILAYGSSRHWFQNKGLLINVIICVALLGGIGWAAVSTMRTTLPLPPDRILLVAVRPRTLTNKLSTDQLRALPIAWQQAIDTRTKFSVILGASLDSEKRLHAFAIAPRFLSLAFSNNVHVQNASAFHVILDRTTTSTEAVPLHELLRLERTLRAHDAAWSANLPLLARATNLPPIPELTHIHGTWDGSHGALRLPASDFEPTIADPSGSLFSVLGPDEPAQTLIVNSLMSQGIDLRNASASISVLSVTPDNASIRVLWKNPLTPEAEERLSAALGKSAISPYTLPDQTVVVEKVRSNASSSGFIPRPFVDQTSSSWRLTATSITYPHEYASTSADPIADCPGHVRLIVQQNALEQLLQAWNIPAAWKSSIQRLQLSEQEGEITICTR